MEKIQDDDEDDAFPKRIRFFAVLAGVGAASFYGYVYCNNKFETLGTWGDFVGGTLNPILTFATFIGLLYTIYLQQRELRLTRKELSLTRQEFERSSNALEAQNLTTKQQRFENTLFSMIEMLNQIVNAMDVGVQGKTQTGRDCFDHFYDIFKSTYINIHKKYIPQGLLISLSKVEDNIPHNEQRLIEAYNDFYKEFQSDLGHYFRVLYNIFRYIDKSDFSNDIYAKILRAQLSNQELLIIFYNCATERGKAFAALAERFELYDNMDTERLLRSEHIELASKKSFGKNPMTLPEEREHPV